MMKLDLMQRFFDTVDEQGESPIADRIASEWFGDGAIVRCHRASANFVFHVASPTGKFFLRFAHHTERNPEAVQAEVDFLNFLAGSGVRVSRPVRSLADHWVESVSTDMGVFHAVVLEALPGDHLEFSELTLEDFKTWGAALGKLHAGAACFSAKSRPQWRDHLEMAKSLIPKTEEAAWTELISVERELSRLPVPDETYGLIHYDFELDNLKWNYGECGILDFDDCSFYWYVADIAFALRDLFEHRVDRVDLTDTRFLAFLEGYRSGKAISDEEVQRIPVLLRFHQLVMFAKLLRTTEDGPLDGEPDWTLNLRKKLINVMNNLCGEFRSHPLKQLA